MKLKALGPGAMWDTNLNSVVYRDSDLDDRESDRRTAEVVKGIADSVTSMLIWTVADFGYRNMV